MYLVLISPPIIAALENNCSVYAGLISKAVLSKLSHHLNVAVLSLQR